VDESSALPPGVLVVVNELIHRSRQSNHESALAAVTWKREVALPAIARAVAETAGIGGLTDWSPAQAEAEAVGLFDRALCFRTYQVRARASVQGAAASFAREETD